VTLFFIISFLFFLKHFHKPFRKKYLICSLVFYFLALGSKELAVILPLLIFSYAFLFKDVSSFKLKFSNSVKTCIPYLLFTFVYFIWRLFIIKGIGGNSSITLSESLSLSRIVLIAKRYFQLFLYPAEPEFFGRFLSSNGYIRLSVLSLLLLLVICIHNQGRMAKKQEVRRVSNVDRILKFILLLTSISILIYKVIYEISYWMVYEKDSTFIMFSVFIKNRYFISGLLSYILLISILLLSLMQQSFRKEVVRFINSLNGKLMIFLFIWLLSILCVHYAPFYFSERHMYLSIVPFSAFISILLVRSFTLIVELIKLKRHQLITFQGCSLHIVSIFFRTAIFLLVFSLLCFFIAHSPLFHSYEEWGYSGYIADEFLHKLSVALAAFPKNSVVHIYNYPYDITLYETRIRYPKSVAYLNDYSIKSWLDLQYPNSFEIFLHKDKGTVLNACPEEVNLDIEKKDNSILIFVRLGKMSK